MKTSTSYRLSNEALRLLKLLAQAKGLSMASVLEIAIRELASGQVGGQQAIHAETGKTFAEVKNGDETTETHN